MGWRRALYGGFQASALASAGWVVFLILQAFIVDPKKTVISVIAGVALHLCWEYGGPWLLGIRAEHEGDKPEEGETSEATPSPWAPFLKWKRMTL